MCIVGFQSSQRPVLAQGWLLFVFQVLSAFPPQIPRLQELPEIAVHTLLFLRNPTPVLRGWPPACDSPTLCLAASSQVLSPCQVLGPCHRCQMICINQQTGQRNQDVFQTLSESRGRKVGVCRYVCPAWHLIFIFACHWHVTIPL
jgi:hypothetical protein